MATTILRISCARTSPAQKFFALKLEFFRAAISRIDVKPDQIRVRGAFIL